MAKINLVRPITARLDDGSIHYLAAGEQEVDQKIADFWYVKANEVGYQAPPPPPGTYAFAVGARLKAEQEAAERKEAESQQAVAREAGLAEARRESSAAAAQRIQADARAALERVHEHPARPGGQRK
jgi:regulator of protease activity HflC (stomatin/prohibitin superfamily)